MPEKSFFRIRVKESCPYPAVMVKNLGKVTKTWQLKKGDASDYAEYPNLDVQPMIREGDTFIPAPADDSAADSESDSAGGPSSGSPAPALKSGKTAAGTGDSNARKDPGSCDFSGMSVEQLKAYLSAKGVPTGELRGMAKACLAARAEAVTRAENGNS